MRGWGRALRAAAVLLLGSIGPALGIGAQAVADSTAVVGVYLDCQGQAGNGCDQNFFRTEILFVNWVTDRAVADVHLLVTAQQAEVGGTRSPSSGSTGSRMTISSFRTLLPRMPPTT